MAELPRFVQHHGRFRFLVDGRPFLILGLQWGCESCFRAEEMLPLFAEAARMGANTAALPLYWREIEPEPGRYRFDLLDARLHGARQAGLRIVLLWFAAWKNGSPFYAPAYVRADPLQYPRARARDGRPVLSLCPAAGTTWARDAAALAAVMEHLRAVDTQHTVILVQLENEPGLLGTDRCYCEACAQQFDAEHWPERWGAQAAEAFSAACMARYIDRLAAHAKAILPLPVYVNVWLGGPPESYPGQYPSGGAVPHLLAVFRAHLQHVDFVAPDVYSTGYRAFRHICTQYGRDQPLYIAEHRSTQTGRAERNVFYALGEHRAIGFDVWAIDEPFPRTPGARPLVDPVDRRWAEHAYALRDSYLAISHALQPVAEAQGTDRLFTFVQEPGETGTSWRAGDCDLLVAYDHPEEAARGMIVRRDRHEFILLGAGFAVRFRRPEDGRPIPVRLAEAGRFAGTEWIAWHPVRREQPEERGLPVPVRRAGVVRVVLEHEPASRGSPG
jgi:hypothetical protein